MRKSLWASVAVASLCFLPSVNAGFVADLKADWSDTNNSNTAAFGTWSYLQGSTLLPSFANFTFGGTGSFSVSQPAWAPSDNLGDFLPAEFKAKSVLAGFDYQVGDVVLHTTDGANGASNGPANFLWTSSINGTVTLAGDVWAARVSHGRDNAWALRVNGVVVSSGSNINAYSSTSPFLFSTGSGGIGALTQNVSVGSTIDLEIYRTSTYGDLVGANLTITGTVATAVPEPSTLFLACVGMATVGCRIFRRRKA